MLYCNEISTFYKISFEKDMFYTCFQGNQIISKLLCLQADLFNKSKGLKKSAQKQDFKPYRKTIYHDYAGCKIILTSVFMIYLSNKNSKGPTPSQTAAKCIGLLCSLSSMFMFGSTVSKRFKYATFGLMAAQCSGVI